MNQQENREIRISPDALIALVVAEAEDRELSAMPSLEEMNAAFHPSEEFQKKMDRLLMKRFVKCFFELLTQIIVKVRKCKVQRVCVLHFQLAGSGGCFFLMKLYH